jgi:NAD(P)H-dependent FMN reductase
MFMKITIISSSQRSKSESRRVGEYIKKVLANKVLSLSGEIIHIDLVDLKLPFFDATLEENEELQKIWNPISKILNESDGFVFITPEWNGMASPILKNLFMFIDEEIAHKPALLVSVSAGLGGGAYPIAELRGNTSKNNYVCYIPNHVIVRNVNECLVDEVINKDNKSDVVARDRIDFSLDTLIAYAKALKNMRTSEKIDWFKFSSGM